MKEIYRFILLCLATGPLFYSAFTMAFLNSSQKTESITNKSSTVFVTNVKELIAATSDPKVISISIENDIDNIKQSIKMSPSQVLFNAGAKKVTLNFSRNVEGIELTKDNEIKGLNIIVSKENRAIFNDTTIEDIGTLSLQDIVTRGQVQLLAKDSVLKGIILVNGLHIQLADTSKEESPPGEFGVGLRQGAFTLWNAQTRKDAIIEASLESISIGQESDPSNSSGSLVSGAGKNGGKVIIHKLNTKDIFIKTNIPDHNKDQMASGVFIGFGVDAKEVSSTGTTRTYGNNEVALENWGNVTKWDVSGPIVTQGEKAMGFVTAGRLRSLHISAPIETRGLAARGFVIHDGAVDSAQLTSIVTYGNASMGIQIGQLSCDTDSNPDAVTPQIGNLLVTKNIETFGIDDAPGLHCVPGTVLFPAGISINPDGMAGSITVKGNIITHGKKMTGKQTLHMPSLEIHGLIKKHFEVTGSVGFVPL